MALTLQHRHLWQGFGDRHGCRTVDDDTQRSFSPMFTKQHYSLSEIGIAQIGRGHKKYAFAKLCLQRNLHGKYPILASLGSQEDGLKQIQFLVVIRFPSILEEVV